MNKHINYRRCNERDIYALKRLWSLCFTNDTPDEIDAFFNEIYPIAVPFAAFDGDEPISMLYLIPAQAHNNDACIPVWYLYAGGTHPSYRSMGYYRTLMTAARDWAMTSDGAAIYLRPAEPSLFEYYSSLGYVEPIYTYVCRDAEMMQNEHAISMDDYLQMRNGMPHLSAFLWEPIGPVVSHFLSGECSAFASNGSLQLRRNGAVYEQLPHASENISRQIAALWIPTDGDITIIDQIKQGVSYSLFFGE